MTYVVTDNCIQCKHTECVDICPADAFREGANFLAIDPEECVDCGLCVPECPEEAIFAESELDDKDGHFIALNAEMAEQWPLIIESKPAMANVNQYSGVADKISMLIR
jgi:ferredoxin